MELSTESAKSYSCDSCIQNLTIALADIYEFCVQGLYEQVH